jgi:hypothetical protein
MPEFDAAGQLQHWVHSAQYEDYSPSASAWFSRFWRDLDVAVESMCLVWPVELRAPALPATRAAMDLLMLARNLEAQTLGIAPTVWPVERGTARWGTRGGCRPPVRSRH